MNDSTFGEADPRLLFLNAANAEAMSPVLVGTKAANLMLMATTGLPVPPGFVLSTMLCSDYHARGLRLEDQEIDLVLEGTRQIEQMTGQRFGGTNRPLLLAVRSGAAVSMPGMLDTILNVGLCDETLPGLLRATGDPVFVWDSYRRLIQAYAEVVDGRHPQEFARVLDEALRRNAVPAISELDVAALRDVVGELKETYRFLVGQPFPQDPMKQLLGATEAVLRSWNSNRAVEYRRLEQLTHLMGTAVTIQAMVFGNMGMTSGSGVAFTRDPATGENRLYVDFLLDAQGEDVVAGRGNTSDSETMIGAVPGLAHELQRVRRLLEATFRDAQDFEFTVQEGRLWLLQTRTAKRTPWAALQIACDLVDEGLIDPSTALERLQDHDVDSIRRFRLSLVQGEEAIGRAVPAGAGVVSGRIALEVESAVQRAQAGDAVILVRENASTDDIAALAVCRGLLTGAGARTSHAAVVARQLGLVCLVNCPGLVVDLQSHTLQIGDCPLIEGDTITIDGGQGRIYAGALDLVEERPSPLVSRNSQLARVPPWAVRTPCLVPKGVTRCGDRKGSQTERTVGVRASRISTGS